MTPEEMKHTWDGSKVLTLGLMAYCVIDEPYVLIGMITGGAIGLAIGCQKYFDFMKDYHTLSDNDND